MINLIRQAFIKHKLINLLLKRKHPPRERLKVIFKFETNKAIYTGYNTQTVDYDACNIEIERFDRNDNSTIILDEELADDGFGGMGGESFYYLVMSAMNHLRSCIKDNEEFILKEEFYK